MFLKGAVHFRSRFLDIFGEIDYILLSSSRARNLLGTFPFQHTHSIRPRKNQLIISKIATTARYTSGQHLIFKNQKRANGMSNFGH